MSSHLQIEFISGTNRLQDDEDGALALKHNPSRESQLFQDSLNIIKFGANEPNPESALQDFAASNLPKFLKLISNLPPLVEDVFLLYYVVGKNQQEIAAILGIAQCRGRGLNDVSNILRCGIEAIGAILAWGSDPKKMNGHAYAATYRKLLASKALKSSRRESVKISPVYGSFEISARSALFEVFA